MEISNKEKTYLWRALLALLIIVSLYYVAKLATEVKSYAFIGGGASASNTISFEGQGEVTATPDIAVVNFTLRSDAKTVKEAQTKVTAMEKSALEFLEKSGIEKKDIKTENYNISPRWDYGVPCYSSSCRQQPPKIVGYDVSESVSVKVRELAQAGDIVGGLGTLGVAELNGPNFAFEDENELKAEARKMAIDEAKKKAETLAYDLGVRLVRITNFSEAGNYPVLPYAAKNQAFDTATEGSAASAPQLPTGENKITSTVVISYEIR